MRRGVIESVPLYGDLHIYLPILAARQGFRVGEVGVRHLEETRWTWTRFRCLSATGARLADVVLPDALYTKAVSFFRRHWHWLAMRWRRNQTSFSLCKKLLFHDNLADRPMLVLGTLLMVLGIQMFSLGLIGELIIFVNAGGVKDDYIEKHLRVEFGRVLRESSWPIALHRRLPSTGLWLLCSGWSL